MYDPRAKLSEYLESPRHLSRLVQVSNDPYPPVDAHSIDELVVTSAIADGLVYILEDKGDRTVGTAMRRLRYRSDDPSVLVMQNVTWGSKLPEEFITRRETLQGLIDEGRVLETAAMRKPGVGWVGGFRNTTLKAPK